MRIADLGCGAGGAAMGLHQAFPDAEIVGVDVRPQPRYPFTFVQGDALEFELSGFGFVWASPPCQAYANLATKAWHRDFIGPFRQKLVGSGVPFIIENIVTAPLHSGAQVCGVALGLKTHRHRRFESSHMLFGVPCPGRTVGGLFGIFGWTAGGQLSALTPHVDRPTFLVGRDVMEMPWASEWGEIREAVPPAYSRYLAQFIPLPLERIA